MPATDDDNVLTRKGGGISAVRWHIGHHASGGSGAFPDRRDPVRTSRIGLLPRPRCIDHRTCLEPRLGAVGSRPVPQKRLLGAAGAGQPVTTAPRYRLHPSAVADAITQ